MSYTHIVGCSTTALFVWHYRTIASRRPSELSFHGGKGLESRDCVIHVDDTPLGTGSNTIDFNKASVVSCYLYYSPLPP